MNYFANIDWITIIGIPATIYTLVDLLIKGFSLLKRMRAKSIVWGKGKAREWVIVLPRYEDKYRREEDILASELILEHCRKLRLKCTIQDDSQSIDPSKNLIFICGPKANRQTGIYLTAITHQIDIGANLTEINDSKAHSSYHTTFDASNQIEKDVAILTRYISPVTEITYIFCVGIHGLGTLGAAKMLTEYRLTKYIKQGSSFESVVEVTSLRDNRTPGPLNFVVPPRAI